MVVVVVVSVSLVMSNYSAAMKSGRLQDITNILLICNLLRPQFIKPLVKRKVEHRGNIKCGCAGTITLLYIGKERCLQENRI